MKLIKNDERGLLWEIDGIEYIKRKKGSISANHEHQQRELLFLLEGEIELTVIDEVKKIKGPTKVEIEPNTFHKIIALTDIIILADKSKC